MCALQAIYYIIYMSGLNKEIQQKSIRLSIINNALEYYIQLTNT